LADCSRYNTQAVLNTEVAAWRRQRNASGACIKCRFTTQKARQKFARAYPDTAKDSKSLSRVLVTHRHSVNLATFSDYNLRAAAIY
jgi:hypothetical protein